MRTITASRADHMPIGELSRLSGVNIDDPLLRTDQDATGAATDRE